MDDLHSLSVGNRRYIGCKAKLADWIMQTIDSEVQDVNSFCDIFAGTAIISELALRKYEKVIINDFLYSNNIIYKAFFENGDVDIQKISKILSLFNNIDTSSLEDNYFSKNFGGKFFDLPNARKIGYVRDYIEQQKDFFSEKEYCILLTSLIYSIDRIANTLGHYEAFIKKEIKPRELKIELINYQKYDSVSIYREDSNHLARQISSDLVYIDPPYNSRQYSRFYHLYETLVKWDNPTLSGTAMKPAPENMSVYCSSRAPQAFEDLILHLKTKYIVVSYNNTYHSKSSSSRNKITLEKINTILSKRGETKVFEHSHQFFNAGKTYFNNHKELLFITKVNEK